MKIDIDVETMGEDAVSDRLIEAVSQCKNGFVVDDVLAQIQYRPEDTEIIEQLVSETIDNAICEDHIERDEKNGVYIFAGDWK